MIERVFTPEVRKALYAVWIAIGPLLVGYGVSLPGGWDTWDQVLFVLLGVGNMGAGALAFKHLPASAAVRGESVPAPRVPGEREACDSVEALRQLLGSAPEG